MRRPTLHQIVQQARRRHEQMADDRLEADGRLGDRELTAFLAAAYPTVAGQRN
jgi:hypothetical protein